MDFVLGQAFGVSGSGAMPPEPPAEPDPIDLQAEQYAAVPVKEVPFKTGLKLTEEQETNMVDRALQRINEVRHEMGIGPTGEIEPNGFVHIRQRNDLSYQGDLSWRLKLGGIFEKSNLTNGSGQRHTRFLSARFQDDLLGTSPFFGAIGRSKDKAQLAKQVEEMLQSEIDRSKVRAGIREAQKIALYRNEAVVKTAWVSDSTPFTGPGTVLIDETGQPALTPEKKLYIFKDDNFLPHPATEGLMLLEKDPSFEAAPGDVEGTLIVPSDGIKDRRQLPFAEIEDLLQRAVTFEGVRVRALDHRAFLCPLKVETVHEADINVHIYRKSINALREMYGGIDVAQPYFTHYDETGAGATRFEQGERADSTSALLEEVTVAEVYMRFDADGDLRDEEILLILDLKDKKPIYYNYLHNHMRKRPFEVIVGLEKIPGRWYGRGIYTLLEDHLLYEDAELNRANFKNSKDASITFAHRSAVEDWASGVAPTIGSKDIYWLNAANWDPKNNPPIFRVNLLENITPDLELMNTMRQAADGLVGAVSLASASQSDMNQSETATGIVSLESAADAITKATESEHADAINDILFQVVDVTLENMDKTKLMISKDGDELIVLNRDEARQLPKDVKLLLTRSRSAQLVNTNKEALVIAKDFAILMATDILTAQRLRDLYVAQLKGLEINEADIFIPEITEDMVIEWQMQQAAQAQAQAAASAKAPQRKAA